MMRNIQNTKGIYEKEIPVSAADSDAFGRMSIGALAWQIGNATAEHMERLGAGAAALREHGLTFVLARTELHIERMPRKGESVRLFGWAGEQKHWMYPRLTEIYSPEGERLVSACSQWMLIDVNSRTLSPPSALMDAVPVVSLEDEPKKPANSARLPKSLPGEASRAVSPQEIDLNGHMNNSHYLSWAVDLLPDEYLENRTPGFLWVEYSKELFEGQRCVLRYAQEEDTLFVRGYMDEERSFSLKMEFNSL